jgi:hypothetical protein
LPHRHRQRKSYSEFHSREGEFVVTAGEPVAYAAETSIAPVNIDHFWITIRTGDPGLLRIAINTYSRNNAAAGFDPRMRVGIVASTWSALPAAGVFQSPGLDYADIESKSAVTFIEYERAALEQLLVEKMRRAIFVEASGELYARGHLGIHQVHSRRASCSVLKDYQGRDGAIRFYFGEDSSAEMLLFKYCGQV